MDTAAHSREPAWLVVRSVPRHGRRVAGGLAAPRPLGPEHYLPLVPIRRRWNVVEWPLFPRHGFRVCGAGAKALWVRNGLTTGSASVVPAQWVQRRDTTRAVRILFEGCDD